MLSAQKEDVFLKVVASDKNVSSLGSFGKVVNSIQGLQQRLGDFTVDDLSQANDKIKTLIFQLADMQGRLGQLSAIMQYAAKSKTAIDIIPARSFDLSIAVDAGGPLPLHALIQASKLIRFPGLSKISKQHNSAAPVTPRQQEANDSSMMTETEAAATLQSHSTQGPLGDSPAVIALPAAAASQTEHHAADREPLPKATETEQVLITDIVPPAEANETTAVAAMEPAASAMPPLPAQAEIDIADEPEAEIATNAPTVETAPAHGRELVPGDFDFDQRLLDDLIKNYGEFAASPNLPTTISPSSVPARDVDRPARSAIPAEEPIRRNVPSLKKQGELDRTLKKLVKDYGEYDLYSRQSPVNLKMGVIGAFLLLAVVFSGFYFFASPKVHDTLPVSSTETSNSNKGDANSSALGLDSSKAKMTSSPKAVELQKSAEASESREKNQRKQNK
jgi:hypothetical protein